jgi:uncharacterized protein (TIGR01777 family)
MRVVITGATGTIGAALSSTLHARGDQVVALTRDADRGRQTLGGDVEVHAWADPLGTSAPADALRGADAVVHLLGEPVAQRWTDAAKRRIRESRVLSTRNLVSALTALTDPERPGVLISQSATGYYGPQGNEPLDESAPAGSDFLAEVVTAWEYEARQAEAKMRVCETRTGVVLSPDGGALAKMLPFFKLGIGGPVAGGRQYVPWIHLDDVIGALRFALDDAAASGPINLTAPNPATNAQLSTVLGRVLHRPAVLPVPGFAINLLYGEMAQMVTTGQRARPSKLQELGYRFAYPELEAALRDVLGS